MLKFRKLNGGKIVTNIFEDSIPQYRLTPYVTLTTPRVWPDRWERQHFATGQALILGDFPSRRHISVGLDG